MKTFLLLLKKNYTLIIIIILLIIIGILLSEKQNLKFSLINYQAIPHIELINTLSYYPIDNSFSGEARGFVVFNNKKNQPRDLRQYFTIEPTIQKDENSNQVFILDEIIVLNSLPPKSIGKMVLAKKDETDKKIILEDKNGVQFIVDKNSKEISMEDAKLITSDSDYRDFMQQFIIK